MAEHVAAAEVEISASPAQVWTALTDPEQIQKYMLGARVKTDWQQGSPIVWKGDYEGKPYEDKGAIVEIESERLLKVTHFSPLSGAEDVPENYHTLTYELDKVGDRTRLSLTQDNNASDEAAEQATDVWEMILAGLKEVVERG